MIKRLDSLLSQPIDSAILGYFRIVFGIVMLIQFNSLQDYFINDLSQHTFFFRYDGFNWMHLLPSNQLQILFIALIISSICFIIGLFYRLNSLILFLGWTYLFLVDRGHYNNHYYFYSLILFFFTFVDANEFASVKSNTSRKKYIPYWQLLVFQLQVFIVYFYGGIAKIDMDWLVGHPMMNILPSKAQIFPSIIASFLSSPMGAIIFSYIGMFFDLFIGFMLFSKRWRYWSLVPIILFHIANHFLWSIGTFPWAMLASTFLFFNPSWPRIGIAYLKEKVSRKKMRATLQSIKYINETDVAFKPNFKTNHLVLFFFSFYFFLQSIIPFRHLFYTGDAAWTGQGHLFAWRMMLNNSDDAIRIKVYIPQDDVTFYVDLLAYMSPYQLNKITKTPKIVLKFVHFIRDEIQERSGVSDVFIHLEMYKSVNYRHAALLNDTSLNYAYVPYKVFGNSSWLLPNKRHISDLRVGIFDIENWEGIFN